MAVPSKTTKFRSEAEQLLSIHLKEMGVDFEHDYRFHDKRRFLFDFAIISPRIAIEVEGITPRGSRHQKFIGYMNDCEKYNLALECGWKLYRVPGVWITCENYYPKYKAFLGQLRTTLGNPFIVY